MKIIIFGASGFLGRNLFDYFSSKKEVIGTYKNKKTKGLLNVDVTNKKEVREIILKHKPDIVIDTIALTSSVACEKDPELSEKLNFQTAKNIAKSCNEIGAKMVFISSSYVFNGKKGDYSETDNLTGTNQYAKTKMMAEKEISLLKNYLILRVDIMYGLHEGKMRFGASTFGGDVIEIGFPNQIRTPVFINDVPKVIDELIEKEENGIFHVAGPDKISTLNFVKKLSEIEGNKGKIKIVDPSNWIVKSPLDSSLNISKIKKKGIKTTPLNNALEIIKLTKFHQ